MKLCRGYVDTRLYKTKGIMLSVVGARTHGLRPANKAETFFVCLCPFHKERTPSFRLFYNEPRQGWWYKCFSCGKSGDVFRFLMLYEDWEFWDALAYLKRHHVQGTFSWWAKPPKLLWIQLKIPFPPIPRDEIEMDTNLPF